MKSYTSDNDSREVLIVGSTDEWKLVAEAVEAYSNYKPRDKKLKSLRNWFDTQLSIY